MELREPKRKCRVRVSLQQPFPLLTDKALWQVYTGKYSGDFVIIDDPDGMTAIHNMGFFGKGSLSRRNPEFGKERHTPPFVGCSQWERRCNWAKQMEAMKNDFETKQEVAVQDSCEEDSNNALQTRREIILATGNQASLVPRESIIAEDRTQERNSMKACGVNTNWAFQKSNSSGSDSDQVTCNVADTVKELNTQDCSDIKESECIKNSANVDKTYCSETNECEQKHKVEINFSNTNKQNRNRGLEYHSSEGTGTCDNCSTKEGIEMYTQSSGERRERRMLLVLPDSDSDYEGYLNNVCPRLEEEQFAVHEALHLTLEEAFFLSFGLGCLQVIDLFGNFLSLDGMWQLFCKSQKDFIQKYVAYHYFRSKGWVVKPGIKFGGDFLLYKQGPPFYHASYIVLVEVINKSTLMKVPGLQRSLSWTRLMGLNRVGESAGKVIWPSEASPGSMEFPSILSKFQVHEVLIRRWISSQEREESDV